MYAVSFTAKLMNFPEMFIALSEIIINFAQTAILIAVFIYGKRTKSTQSGAR